MRDPNYGYGEVSAGDFIEAHFDFVTCRRADGTTYGAKKSCQQKGSKEVKASDKAVEGGYTISKKMRTQLKTEKATAIKKAKANADKLKAKAAGWDSLIASSTGEAKKQMQLAQKLLKKAADYKMKGEVALALGNSKKAQQLFKDAKRALLESDKAKKEADGLNKLAKSQKASKASGKDVSAGRRNAQLTEIAAAGRDYNAARAYGMTTPMIITEIKSYAKDLAKIYPAGPKRTEFEQELIRKGRASAGL